MNALRLRDDIWLQLEYRDTTPFGSMVSGRLESQLKLRLDPVVAPLIAAQWRDVDHVQACRAVREAVSDLYLDADHLREEFLYPDPLAVTPDVLVVHTTAGELGRVQLPEEVWPQLATWVGNWQQGLGQGGVLWEALRTMGALTELPLEPRCEHLGVTWVGHACARVATATVRVLVDPFFPAHDASQRYRPMSVSQLGANLVLITHSHPDHYDLGTLLRLGPECDIVVPSVPRESALSINIAARLQQLGFQRVHRLAWNDSLCLDEVTVKALPFFGEQAGDGDQLHAEVRNFGNLYTVQTPSVRVAFSADAGADALGDVRNVAQLDRQQHGPIDVLFSGCRAWSLYPAQLLRSSVRRYALFVPEASWARRHQLMAGLHEALDVAERWGAHSIVPYADGGAPWHWSIGLGPDLSAFGQSADSHFDPRPEALEVAARTRSSWGSTPISTHVQVQLLHPGEAWPAGAAMSPAQRWPYPRVRFDEFAAPREDEMVAVGRKKALLRVLALELSSLRGIEVDAQEVQALSNHVRRVAGLTRRDDMMAWLDRANLSLDEFTLLMQEWARCNVLEQAYEAEIDSRLPGQLALHAMRNAAAFVRRPS